jgi:predicted TIM-barrel fold metal-dependent hydrolase
MQMPASEYFLRHMRITTYGFEWPREPDRLIRALKTVPKIEDLLMYASGWPNADFEDPGLVAARLPEAWRDKVMHGNAESFFRWPATASSAHTAKSELSTGSESR